MVNAARRQWSARFLEFLAGRGSLDILLEASLCQMAAERQAADNDTEKLDALGNHWERAFLIAFVNKARHDAGRIPTKEYFECVAFRLDGENEFANLQVSAGHRLPFPPGQGMALNQPNLAKDLAKAKRAAAEPDSVKIRDSKRELSTWAFWGRIWAFLGGYGSLDIILEDSRKWLGADLDVATSPAERLAAYERHWESTQMVETINSYRHEAGRIPVQDFAQSTSARLDAQIRVLQASRGRDFAQAWTGGSEMARFLMRDREAVDPVVFAKIKFAAVRSHIDDLIRQRLIAQRTQYDARFTEFVAGRGTLDILLEAIEDLADAERAAGVPELQVLERRVLRLISVAKINEERYLAARIPVQDFYQPIYYLTKAKLELLIHGAGVANPRPRLRARHDSSEN
jgi:hypothetical protein